MPTPRNFGPTYTMFWMLVSWKKDGTTASKRNTKPNCKNTGQLLFLNALFFKTTKWDWMWQFLQILFWNCLGYLSYRPALANVGREKRQTNLFPPVFGKHTCQAPIYPCSVLMCPQMGMRSLAQWTCSFWRCCSCLPSSTLTWCLRGLLALCTVQKKPTCSWPKILGGYHIQGVSLD